MGCLHTSMTEAHVYEFAQQIPYTKSRANTFITGSPPALRLVEDDVRKKVEDDFRQKMPGVSPAFNLFALWSFIPSP